jgi:XTP/dITP diphosphohydrolase
MKEIVLATRNKHKVEEIANILKGCPVKILSLDNFKDVPDVIEDKPTLKGNAVKKAKSVAICLKKWALADDTGLEVEYLKGEPGVYSARFAGPGCTYDDNNRKLLGLLKGVPKSKRRAQFRCVIALSDAKGRTKTVEGNICGYICRKAKGKKGFGYDPIFFVPGYKKTFAQLRMRDKNKISHRGKALNKARELIEGII